MCASLYAEPRYETTVDQDVPYSEAIGYRTEAPVGDPVATLKLILHQGKPHRLALGMDIYRPVGDGESLRPLLLMMHGGSFFIGHKAEAGQAGWCRHFASLGYVAVSIDYRLGFRFSRKDIRAAEVRALEDAESAVGYLLGREDLRIDPDHPECCYDRKIAGIHIFSCLRALVGGAVFIAVAVTMVLGIISTANGW